MIILFMQSLRRGSDPPAKLSFVDRDSDSASRGGFSPWSPLGRHEYPGSAQTFCDPARMLLLFPMLLPLLMLLLVILRCEAHY